MWYEEGHAIDASHRFDLYLYRSRSIGSFPPSWRYVVKDHKTLHTLDEQVCVTDADAWSEGWATIALLRANLDSKLDGGYSIGTSGY